MIRFKPAHFDESFFIKLLEKIQDYLGNWSMFVRVVTGSFRNKGNCRSWWRRRRGGNEVRGGESLFDHGFFGVH